MMNLENLRKIAEKEFADIVIQVLLIHINEMRIILIDGSFIDVWFSLKLKGRYSYHWERRAIDGQIYRHDNAPHRRWQSVSTFPRTFHDGSEDRVSESYISEDPAQALREFLGFAREKLRAAPLSPPGGEAGG
jgi:hypothetical protein